MKRRSSSSDGNKLFQTKISRLSNKDVQNEKTKENSRSEPSSLTDLQSRLTVVERCYKAKMPQDFRLLWEFCAGIQASNPATALKSSLGILLVGPFDLLRKPQLENESDISWMLHYRYFYDPPQFTTVMIKVDDKELSHWGYVRDKPDELPVFVALNKAAHGGEFRTEGENLFAALYHIASKADNKQMSEKLKAWAEKHNLPLEEITPKISQRNKLKVAKPLNNLGLVVPVTDDDIGYRPLPESNGAIKRILNKIVAAKTENERVTSYEPLDEMITLVQFANDEGDYGEGVELGLDLLSCKDGKVFNTQINHLLGTGYELLGWKEFSDIARAHMKHRVMGGRVSQTWGKL